MLYCVYWHESHNRTEQSTSAFLTNLTSQYLTSDGMMCDYLLVAPLSPEIQTENIHNAHSDELAGDETAYAYLTCIFVVSPSPPESTLNWEQGGGRDTLLPL